MSDSGDCGRVKPGLSVRGLVAGYGGTPVVKDVSLDVPRGRVTLVIGANGSGKSTLAKALAGVIPKIAGTVLLGDDDLTAVRSDLLVRKGLGYVPQAASAHRSSMNAESFELVSSIVM